MIVTRRSGSRALQAGTAMLWAMMAIVLASASAGIVGASLMRRVHVVRLAIERGNSTDLAQAAQVLARATARTGRPSAVSLTGGRLEAHVACPGANPSVRVTATSRATGQQQVVEVPAAVACP